MPDRYDLVVIGCGPAGEKGAAQAAYFGKRVAVIERAPHPGGAAVNTGTIPSKTLRETALYFSGLRQRGLYGIDYSLKEGVTVQDFLYREQAVVEKQRAIIQKNLDRHGIELIHGEASLTSRTIVRVRTADGATRDLHTEFILIASGSSPFHPEGVPFDDKRFYDSDSILKMTRMPKRMAVVGGGVIGCEYAALFAALDVDVVQLTTGNQLLPFVDREIAERLHVYLEHLGVRFVFNDRVVEVRGGPTGATLVLERGGELTEDIVLFAAGRTSNIEGLGLEALGVKTGPRGLIEVNDKYQTTVPNIYAAGDVVGFPALASTSIEQARVAMVHAFNLQYKQRLSPVLPVAIYTIPEIAMAGLTEEDCQAKGIPYLTGRSTYEGNPRGQIIGDMTGMLKLVFAPEDKRLLGVHHIGELASELVHIGAHVLAEGGTIDAFIDACYNYPSLSDIYKYAAYDCLGAWDRWRGIPSLVGKPNPPAPLA
jgi:NAD(P) transhydrogenase